jgi:putative phosphoribosyl transferase
MSETTQRGAPGRSDGEVEVLAGQTALAGNLVIPPDAIGSVIFAHGSGSSRFSPRNQFVARVLQEAGIATLLLDLLTPAEEQLDERTRQLRFDIQLLADRLAGATDWLRRDRAAGRLGVGYFGASTGGGAALIAAVERRDVVRAVVSRGGRPDLAGMFLSQVEAPTLLIVGGDDAPVIELNRRALAQLRFEKRLEIVPGATHIFEEPGALEQVARLARDWFQHHF